MKTGRELGSHVGNQLEHMGLQHYRSSRHKQLEHMGCNIVIKIKQIESPYSNKHQAACEQSM